jgi:hypothetical protein
MPKYLRLDKSIRDVAESVLTKYFYKIKAEKESGVIWTFKWASGEDVREPQVEHH